MKEAAAVAMAWVSAEEWGSLSRMAMTSLLGINIEEGCLRRDSRGGSARRAVAPDMTAAIWVSEKGWCREGAVPLGWRGEAKDWEGDEGELEVVELEEESWEVPDWSADGAGTSGSG